MYAINLAALFDILGHGIAVTDYRSSICDINYRYTLSGPRNCGPLFCGAIIVAYWFSDENFTDDLGLAQPQCP